MDEPKPIFTFTGERHSQAETARALGITRQRVDQIEKSALKKLRKALAAAGITRMDQML